MKKQLQAQQKYIINIMQNDFYDTEVFNGSHVFIYHWIINLNINREINQKLEWEKNSHENVQWIHLIKECFIIIRFLNKTWCRVCNLFFVGYK
jgi:hypothetical protein